MPNPEPIRGSCLCGGVSFELRRAAGPFELCHCPRCRKASGSAFVAGLGVRTEDLRLLSGHELIRRYEAPIREAPPAYRTAFCGRCGSPVPDPPPGAAWFEVPAGLLDGDPQLRPDRHIFVHCKSAWYAIADTLPQLDAEALRELRRRSGERSGGAKQPMPQVEFWFEFGSTYSYPAALRIEEVARAAGVALSWHPFLLGPIFKAQGWNDSPFNLYPAKGRYMWRDLERVCTALAIPLRRPSQFPRNGLLAARLACHFSGEPWVPDFVRAVYRANFAEDRDISDASVVGSILESVGQSASLLASAESADAKAKLRAETQRAEALGIFGAPAFVVDSELFWGNDRLEAAIAWAQRKHARAL